MTKRIVTPVLALLSVATAACAASCHCADPNPASPSSAGGGVGGGVASTSRALMTAGATTDAEFLSGNFGYGQWEDVSISGGAVRRSAGVYGYGLPNVGTEQFGWRPAGSVTAKRSGHASVVHNGLLYTLGGQDAGLPKDDVFANVLNADGSIRYILGLGTFPTARTDHAAVIHNGFVYIIGGYASSGALDDVRFAKIREDGSLDAWAATTPLPPGAQRSGHTAAVYNGWLYVIGGDGTQYFNDIIKARLNPDGTIGAWSAAGAFAGPRTYHRSGINLGWLYVIGGYDGANPLDDVQVAAIGPDGNVAAFTATTALPTAIWGMGCVVARNTIYLVGGFKGSAGTSADLLTSSLETATGAAGSWVASPVPLSTGRGSLSAVMHSGFLYAIAGSVGSDTLSDIKSIPTFGTGTGVTWRTTSTLPTARSGHAGAFNGYTLYLLGGSTGAGPTSDIRHADVRTTGQLSPWIVDAAPPWAARYGLGAAVHKGRIYVAGGRDDGGNFFKDVWHAPLNADGTVGAWVQAPDFDAIGRAFHGIAVVGGFLHIFGGNLGNSHLDSVRFAPIGADGSPANWASTTPISLGGRSAMGVAVRGNTVYLTGGRWGTNPSDVNTTVVYGDIEPATGQIASWITSPVGHAPLEAHQSVIVNGHLYVIGGRDVSNHRREIQRTALNADRSLAGWSFATTTLSSARASFAANVYNGYLYLTGGADLAGPMNTVEVAPFNAGGTAGEWRRTTDLTPGRFAACALANPDFLYILGGATNYTPGGSLNEVWFAPFSSDGSLGAVTQGPSFQTARYGHTCAISNGYMYILGGHGDGIDLADVQVAKLMTDGTGGLDAWAAARTLTGGWGFAAAAASNGYLYITGPDVKFSRVNPADGSLDPWTATTMFAGPRYGHAAFIFNGYLYVLGGFSTSDSVYKNDVQFAKLNADGTVGQWTATSQFNLGRYMFSAAVYNGFVFIYGGSDGSLPLGDVQSALINPDGTLGAWATVASLPAARDQAAFASHNHFLYLLGGATGGTGSTETYSAPIVVQPSLVNGQHTTRFDLGADATMNHIYIDGSIESGSVLAQYRTAAAGQPYGAWSASQNLTALPATVNLGVTARYIEFLVSIQGLGVGRWSNEVTQLSLDTNPLPPGANCQTGGDCASTFCVGGVCCATACDQPGECNEVGTCAGGQCSYPSKPAGWPCTDTTPDDCYKAGCVAGGSCDQQQALHDQGVVCRTVAAGDVCDLEDSCTGTSGACEDKIFGINAQVCRQAGVECENDVFCDGANKTCPTTQSYNAGTPCTPDAFSCTQDICDPAGTGQCVHPVAPTMCLIEGNCRYSGEKNPANACETCNPAVSETYWSPATGQSCNDNQMCSRQDQCQAATGVLGKCSKSGQPCTGTPCPAGETCVFPGECKGTLYNCPAPKDCEESVVCDGTGGCVTKPKQSGASCTADSLECTRDICNGSGTCTHTLESGYCSIGSPAACWREGDRNPQNNCEVCKAINPDAWTTLKSFEQCNDDDPCTKDDACQPDGRCKGSPDPTCSGRCSSDADCAGKPGTHCDQQSGNCFECVLDAHCGTGKTCNIIDHVCVDAAKCQTDLQCRQADPKKPVCVSGICIECRDDLGCKGLFSDRQVCFKDLGACVECVNDSDCSGGQACNQDSFTCVGQQTDGGPVTGDGGDAGKPDGGTDAGKDTGTGCTSNAQCGDATPVCNVADGECVECMESSTCVIGHPGKIYCSTSLHKCVECLTSYTCKGGRTCDTGTGTCVGGSTDDTGQPTDDAGEPAPDGGGTTPAGEDAGEAAAEGIKNPYGCMCGTLSVQ